MLDDWDFDNLVTAHMGNRIGGAKKVVTEMFMKELPALEKLSTVPKQLVCCQFDDAERLPS